MNVLSIANSPSSRIQPRPLQHLHVLNKVFDLCISVFNSSSTTAGWPWIHLGGFQSPSSQTNKNSCSWRTNNRRHICPEIMSRWHKHINYHLLEVVRAGCRSCLLSILTYWLEVRTTWIALAWSTFKPDTTSSTCHRRCLELRPSTDKPFTLHPHAKYLIIKWINMMLINKHDVRRTK